MWSRRSHTVEELEVQLLSKHDICSEWCQIIVLANVGSRCEPCAELDPIHHKTRVTSTLGTDIFIDYVRPFGSSLHVVVHGHCLGLGGQCSNHDTCSQQCTFQLRPLWHIYQDQGKPTPNHISTLSASPSPSHNPFVNPRTTPSSTSEPPRCASTTWSSVP